MGYTYTPVITDMLPAVTPDCLGPVWCDVPEDFEFYSSSANFSIHGATGMITALSPGGGTVTVRHKITGKTKTFWVGVYNKSAAVNNYYDIGFNVRYASPNTNIPTLTDLMDTLFIAGYGLHVARSNSQFTSHADECKIAQGLSLANLATFDGNFCPGGSGHACTSTHSGCESADNPRPCTHPNESYHHFIEEHKGAPTCIFVLWSGHEFNDNDPGTKIDNRSFQWYDYGINMQKLVTPASDYYTVATPVLLHELSHAFGAIDHYHEEVERKNAAGGTVTYCRGREFCSGIPNATGGFDPCPLRSSNENPYNPRPGWCLMNTTAGHVGVTGTTATNSIWCPGCQSEIRDYIRDEL